MGGAAAQRRRREDEEHHRNARREEESNFMRNLRPVRRVALRAGHLALQAALFPLALLGGCAPSEPFPRPRERSNPREDRRIQMPELQPDFRRRVQNIVRVSESGEQLYWWPGYVVRDGEIVDVSLGFRQGYRRSTDPAETFTSRDAIPQEMRDAGRADVAAGLDLASYFLKEDVYNIIMNDNVFMPYAMGRGGGSSGAHVNGYRLVDAEGQEIACCFEGCPQYENISFAQSGGRVLFHELLHNAWFEYLSESERNDFATKARLFFNVLGDTWGADELIGAIWSGYYHTNPENRSETRDLGFEPHLAGGEVEEWANETLSGAGLTDAEINYIKISVMAYFEIRNTITFGRTLGRDSESRDDFIIVEGFAYMGANDNVIHEIYDRDMVGATRMIPAMFYPTYSSVLRPERLDLMMHSGFGYFAYENNFREFIPYIESFVAWMKMRYPELDAVGR